MSFTDIGKNIATKQFELPRGRYAQGRFMLDSPDNFIFLANTAGEVEVYVGLDADTVSAKEGTYIWSTVSRAGIAQLAISTSDRNFHMGTWYYFYVYAREESLVNLEVKQARTVNFIPNNHDFTYQLTYANTELLNQKF